MKDLTSKNLKLNGSTFLTFEQARKLSYEELENYAKQIDISSNGRDSILCAILKHSLSNGEIVVFSGFLEMENNYGILRDISKNFLATSYDVYVGMNLIKAHQLRAGDYIVCEIHKNKTDEQKYFYAHNILMTDGKKKHRLFFDNLTPTYPTNQIIFENPSENKSYRIISRCIDLIVPMGFGQRAIISAPPFTGKTTIMHSLAVAISQNYKNCKLIILLIGERPEEVTEMKNIVPNAEIIYSTFDNKPSDHIMTCEMTMERSKRLVEMGQDVVILMDSITRLVRSNNSVVPPSGRVLSGGVDPTALEFPRRFFGAARNTKEAGSLTIIATNLVDTGSKMDEVIFEEFKGTGNSEIALDRNLSNKKIFPAISLSGSGTRRMEYFLSPTKNAQISLVHKALVSSDISLLSNRIEKTTNNEELLRSLGNIPSY